MPKDKFLVWLNVHLVRIRLLLAMLWELHLLFRKPLQLCRQAMPRFEALGIKKGLPETEEQALVFLYMASSQVSADEYAILLDDYVRQYPTSVDGYMRRANNWLITRERRCRSSESCCRYGSSIEGCKEKGRGLL